MSQRSTLLMKHCRQAGPVALSKPWSALWAHTPTMHPPPPPLAYQGENSQGRESEPRERKMVRMREREEQEVTDLYQPPTSPLSCARKSKLHLLTAFMIWHSRKMSENCHKCFQSENKPDLLFAHGTAGAGLTQSDWKWKKGQVGFLHLPNTVDAGLFCQLSKIQFTVAPFQVGHQLCSQAHTHRWGEHPAMHITNRSHVSSVDLFCSKLFCAAAVFPLACVLALCVSLSLECITCSGNKRLHLITWRQKQRCLKTGCVFPR